MQCQDFAPKFDPTVFPAAKRFACAFGTVCETHTWVSRLSLNRLVDKILTKMVATLISISPENIANIAEFGRFAAHVSGRVVACLCTLEPPVVRERCGSLPRRLPSTGFDSPNFPHIRLLSLYVCSSSSTLPSLPEKYRVLLVHARRWERVGAELEDSAVPSAEQDVFVLARPNSGVAAVGGCSPTAAVTFREPGRAPFQLELPLSSSLEDVEAALASASRPSRQQETRNKEHRLREEGAGESRKCTLIIGGKRMSTSCLLGDYLLMASAVGKRGNTALRTTRWRATPILVLWQPLWRERPSQAANAVANADHPQRPGLRPVVALAAVASAPPPLGSQDEAPRMNTWRARRSVPRRCKGAARFSGLKRGTRCGMGIRRFGKWWAAHV